MIFTVFVCLSIHLEKMTTFWVFQPLGSIMRFYNFYEKSTHRVFLIFCQFGSFIVLEKIVRLLDQNGPKWVQSDVFKFYLELTYKTFQLFDPRPMEGPIKLPVCPSVCPSIWHFSQEWVISFLFFLIVDTWNI